MTTAAARRRLIIATPLLHYRHAHYVHAARVAADAERVLLSPDAARVPLLSLIRRPVIFARLSRRKP